MGEKWLDYVIEVFREVTGTPLDLSKVHYGSEAPSGFRGVYIPKISVDDATAETSVRFSGDIFKGTVIDGSEIPIYHPDGTLPANAAIRTTSGVTFTFDAFRNAFLRLSCATERRRERLRGPHHGYCPPDLQSASYLKPVVNYLFEAIKAALSAVSPNSAASLLPKPASPLLLTHDIDAVHRTFLKAAKQSVMNLAKMPSALRRPGSAGGWDLLKSAAALPFGADDFDRIEDWRDWDRTSNAETAYYVYARLPYRTVAKRLKAMVFDPDYDVAGNKSLAGRLRKLRQQGCIIGLHGSFASYDDAERLSAEKACLEQAIDAPVDQIRQHWLRFRFDDTWRAQREAGFTVDTGFGFNNVPGFRSWICHPYRPWDERSQAAHDLTVIPMTAMDSTLFDYQDLPPEKILETLGTIMSETKKFGGLTAFNWHTHGASHRLRWDEAYRCAIAMK